MKKLLLFTALLICEIATAKAQFGGTLIGVGKARTITLATPDEIEKLENDGWFQVTSYYYYDAQNKDKMRTWVKSVRRGNVNMFMAIILDSNNEVKDKSEKVITKNGYYGNPAYNGKLEGMHSHKFILGGCAFYLDLDGVAVNDDKDNDFLLISLFVAIPIIIGMIFLVYMVSRKK